MQGLGIYKWNDGRMYKGQYQDDKKNGYGIYCWQDKRQYQGYWLVGKQHGLGIYSVPSENRIQFGLWEQGKRIVEWFDPDTQYKINTFQIDYTQFFKNQESIEGLPENCSFNIPSDFKDWVNTLSNRLEDLRLKTKLQDN